VCAICTELVKDPVSLRPCQHMFCTSCIQGVVANAAANDLEIICPICRIQFSSPNDLVQPSRIERQVLGRLLMICPHDGCQEQITYDQYDTHIVQCQNMCEHCNQEYLRSDKDEHEANCLDLIKFQNSELSAKLVIVKRNSGQEREKFEAEIAKARAELASMKSQFQNVTILPAGFKYFENDVFVTQLKQATTTSFDWQGHNSHNNYDWFASYSANEQFTGGEMYVLHKHFVYSDKKEDGISLHIERAETTETIEAMWNLKIFQNGKKLFDRDLKYTFEKDTCRGRKVEKNCDESEFTVIVTIKEWNVTDK